VEQELPTLPEHLSSSPVLSKLKFISNSLQAEFEDTKGAIIIRISKKNRQHNGQKKKYKRTNNDLQNIHIKLKRYGRRATGHQL
jgi:hypothetical protein